MDALQRRIDDEGQLGLHAVRIREPDAVERAEILDRAVGGAACDEPITQRLEVLGRRSTERDVVEVPALEHRRQRGAVSVLGNLGGMDPRVLAGAEDGVTERRGRLTEHDLELEHVSIELDEAVEVGGQDGNVVDAGQHGHRAPPAKSIVSATATVSAASAPSMSQ